MSIVVLIGDDGCRLVYPTGELFDTVFKNQAMSPREFFEVQIFFLQYYLKIVELVSDWILLCFAGRY